MGESRLSPAVYRSWLPLLQIRASNADNFTPIDWSTKIVYETVNAVDKMNPGDGKFPAERTAFIIPWIIIASLVTRCSPLAS